MGNAVYAMMSIGLLYAFYCFYIRFATALETYMARADEDAVPTVRPYEPVINEEMVQAVEEALAEPEDTRPPKPELVYDEVLEKWIFADEHDVQHIRRLRMGRKIVNAMRGNLIVVHSPDFPSDEVAPAFEHVEGIAWVQHSKGEMSKAWVLDRTRGKAYWRSLGDDGSGVRYSLIGTNDTLLAVQSVNHPGLKGFSIAVQRQSAQENVALSQMGSQWIEWAEGLSLSKREAIMRILSVYDDVRQTVSRKRKVDLS